MRSPDPLLLVVEAAARREGFTLDPAQAAVAGKMVRAATRALDGHPARGVYLHGPAGRGKSWLADAVYGALPPNRATRVHVHGFFDDLHRRIHSHRGESDPTTRAIDDVVGESRVVFFDELHVHDPGDARLLTRLLERLLERGTTIVATSNYAPHDLMPDPVWHHLFVPGIALITSHLDVCSLVGPTDYRLLPPASRRGFRAGSWRSGAPRDASAGSQGASAATGSSGAGPGASVASPGPSAPPGPSGAPPEGSAALQGPPSESQTLVVRDRTFSVTSADAGTMVATFAQLCESPLAASEYRSWAAAFAQWTITDVPPFDEVGPAGQQRFVTLIDVLVDADVHLDVHSAVELEEFLARSAGRPDAFRMASRLRLLQHE